VSNYTDLKNDIALWLADEEIVNTIPSFIRLAETKINRKLDILPMEVTISATVEPTETALGTNWITHAR